MSTVTRMFLNLIVIASLSGVILSSAFDVADPVIQANKAKELKESIFKVLPEAKDFVAVEKSVGKDTVIVYKGVSASGGPAGIAFKADGGGFQGNIGVMVGLDLDALKLKGIEILEQLETPGLGDRIREDSFRDQFKGLEVKPRIEYIKYRKPEKPNQIQAITGATISSDAVIKNINNAIDRVLGSFTKEELSIAAEAAQGGQAGPGGPGGPAATGEAEDGGQ